MAIFNLYGHDVSTMPTHAHTHAVGRHVGVKRDDKIVAATVIAPLPGQDNNILRVQLMNGAVKEVHAMTGIYRFDYVDSVL